MSGNKFYFGKSLILISLSIVAFLYIKKYLPPRLFPEQVIYGENILLDSLMLDAISGDLNDTLSSMQDSLIVEDSITSTTSIPNELIPQTSMGQQLIGIGTPTTNLNSKNIVNPKPSNILDPSISGEGYLNLRRFYTKLHNLETSKQGKVRVAYFGDSMTDGDLIVQDIRAYLQNRFGGEGVGFVSIGSLSAGSRGTVSHQFSKNWKIQSFVNAKHPTKAFGIDGQVYMVKGGNELYWANYKAQNYKNATELYSPTLFYGKSGNTNASIKIIYGENHEKEETLNPSSLLNTMKVSENTKKLKVDFIKADSIPFYGFNFDNGQGVHVDNFSIRGNSGLPLGMFSVPLMNAFDKELNYDLIILQYGTNVLSHSVKSYGWYENKMKAVVQNLHRCFPNADILIVSVGDKSTKVDGEMQTDPVLKNLLTAQQNYARVTASGYINLYDLMGGNNSMIKWVEDGMAGKDYTHFNAKGAKKVAKFIYDELDKGYIKYKSNPSAGTLR